MTAMTDASLLRLSATDAAAAIRDRELSPVELVEAVLDSIDRTQGTLNAFVTVCADEARMQARSAERAVMRGGSLPPLCGVPFSVKDLTYTKGVRTTMGSAIFADHVPSEDAVPVARLKAAGAILIGKTTTPEFGHKPFTDGPLFGVTRNPWGLDRTAGGSSGGAAAAVAAGLGQLALGTDGGGSIRIPAACCGIVGHKPTLGRVPHIHAPDLFGNNSFIGPMARTVGDARLMLDVIEGPHPGDPYAGILPGHAPALPGDLTGLRAGFVLRAGNRLLDPEIEARVVEALRVLEELGASVTPIEIDFVAEEENFIVLLQSTLAGRLAPQVDAFRDRVDPTLAETVRRGLARSAADLVRAQTARSALYRRIVALFETIDVLISPTLSAPALPLGLDLFAPVEIAGECAGSVRGAWYPYTYPFNLTGHPALSVPWGWTQAGLPVGLQLVGRWYADLFLFDIAARLEGVRPWAERWPAYPLSGSSN